MITGDLRTDPTSLIAAGEVAEQIVLVPCEDGPMELGAYAQSCANAYRDLGEQHGWHKGRNSSRGYDLLTVPDDTWDDRPHERYLLVVNHHLSSAAAQLDACGGCFGAGNSSAVATLATAVFVESSKASWLLEGGVTWTQRAARAHLELVANLDAYVRRLPKRLESGYPSFRRRQFKLYRDQMRDDVIEALFGKRALSKRDDMTLAGERLLTSSHLEEQFADLLVEHGLAAIGAAGAAAPDVLIDPLATLQVDLANPPAAHGPTVDQPLIFATKAWLDALDSWVRYNAWDRGAVERLWRLLPSLPGPPA